MKSIKLDVLKEGLEGISQSLGSWMCECSIVCFLSQDHNTGVRLKVVTGFEGTTNEVFFVNWDAEVSEKELRSHNDDNRTTDFGSMAVALLLASQLTEFTSFETSKTGSGIDFWLSNDSDDSNFFGARLEISGIRKATKTNTLDKRLKIKLTQVSQSDNTSLPAYIAIIEFGKPESAFIKK